MAFFDEEGQPAVTFVWVAGLVLGAVLFLASGTTVWSDMMRVAQLDECPEGELCLARSLTFDREETVYSWIPLTRETASSLWI